MIDGFGRGFTILIDEHTGRATIDRIILELAMRMPLIGVLKKGICGLKIRDIYIQGEIVHHIDLGNGKFSQQLDQQSRAALLNYIRYLQSKSYSTNPDEPLFPPYYGQSGQKTLMRHIKQHTNFRDFHVLRKEAVRFVQEQTKKTGVSHEKSIEVTANLLKKTTRAIRGAQQKRKINIQDADYHILKIFDEIPVWNDSDILSSRNIFSEKKIEIFKLIDEMTEDEKTRLKHRQNFLAQASERISAVTRKYAKKDYFVYDFKNDLDIDKMCSLLEDYLDNIKDTLDPEEREKFEKSKEENRNKKVKRESIKRSKEKSKSDDQEVSAHLSHDSSEENREDYHTIKDDHGTPDLIHRENIGNDSRAKKMRLYELARELDVENEEMIKHLNEIGIQVKSYSSTIDEAVVKKIRRKFRAKKEIIIEPPKLKKLVE